MPRTIIVASLEEAEELLESDPDAKTFPHVISISAHPTKDRPKSLKSTAPRDVLLLTFADTDVAQQAGAPQKKDVERALRWAHGKSKILVHCFAGISRSTAIAILLTRQESPPGTEDRCVDAVASSVPQRRISPNCLIIQLGDGLLDCGGKLQTAVKNLHSANQFGIYGSLW